MKKRFLFSFICILFFQETDSCRAMVDSSIRLEIIVWLGEGNVPREMKRRQRCAFELLQKFEEMINVIGKDLSFFEQWCMVSLLGGCYFFEYFSYDLLEAEKNQNEIEQIFKQAGTWHFWQAEIYNAFKEDSPQDIYLKKLEKALFTMFEAIIGDFVCCNEKRILLCQDVETQKEMRAGSVSCGYAFCCALEKFVKQARELLDANSEKCSIL